MKNKGFTLAEILVIVLVIAILAGIAIPVYTKAIIRSRAADALKVLALASSKQELFLINNNRYAADFTELAAPVKGLIGTGAVPLGYFIYEMTGACITAARPADNYTIFRNFETQETGCAGAGCDVIRALVPAGVIGCDLTRAVVLNPQEPQPDNSEAREAL